MFPELNQCLDYFKSSFGTKYKWWFEGCANFTPSTNNALEAFNNILKKKYFNYEKRYMLECLDILKI